MSFVFCPRPRKIFLLFGLFAFLTACQPDEYRDIRGYYFPLKELKDGLTYEYRSLRNDSLAPNYWYYRSFVKPDSIFLTGTYYEYDLLPQQFIREEMVSNGVLLEEMYVYARDSTGEQHRSRVEVLQGNAFPFEVRDSGGVFLYKIRWQSPTDTSITTTLIKNRIYRGDTTYQYKGETLDCIFFEVRELVEQEQEGFLEQEFSGLEFYAKELGLVYYRKDIQEDFTLEYGLHDRYSMDRLEEKFKAMYGVEE